MAATGRYRLQKPVLDHWSTREKLALASSVMRTGDQNWVSVSRTIRPYAELERPENWFSQKSCALQYSDLLEKVDTPKRKRNDKEKEQTGHVETPGAIIVRKLTIERIEELKQLVQESQDKFIKLKQELEEIQAGHQDEHLHELWAEIQSKCRTDVCAVTAIPTVEIKTEVLHVPDLPTPSIQKEKAMWLPDCPNSPYLSATHDLPQAAITGEDESSLPPLPELTPDVLDAALHFESSSLSDLLQKSPPEPVADLEKLDLKEILSSVKEETVDVEGDVDTQPLILPQQNTVASKKHEITSTIAITADVTTPTVSMETEIATEVKKQPILLEEDNSEVQITDGLIKDIKEERKADEKVDEDEDKELNTSVFLDTSLLKEEAPSSPSSVVSCDTDGGSSTRGKGRIRRRRGRRPADKRKQRFRTKKFQEDDGKEADAASKASELETSDDEDESKNEESDTASTAPIKNLMCESMPNSPASTGLVFNSEEEEKSHKLWKKSIMLVWRAAANHKYANVFLHPVTEDIAPGYSSVVFRPKNLQTIKKHIETGMIRTTPEFQRDIMLMFTNAIMYNNSDHNVHNMAMEMYDDVMNHIEQYVSTQLMVKEITPKVRHRRIDPVESVPPPETGSKLLRGSRRSETQAGSDKEDDRKRRISMETPDCSSGGKAKKRKT